MKIALSPNGTYVVEVHTSKGNVAYLSCDIYGSKTSMKLVDVENAGTFSRTDAIEFADRVKEFFKPASVALMSRDQATHNVHLATLKAVAEIDQAAIRKQMEEDGTFMDGTKKAPVEQQEDSSDNSN